MTHQHSPSYIVNSKNQDNLGVLLMSSATSINDLSLGCFGDARLARIGVEFFQGIVSVGSCVIRKLSGSRAQQVSFNRFIWNERVTTDEIKKTALDRTMANTADASHVLAIQDTTEVDFTRRRRTVEGLGPIGDNYNGRVGFYLHPTLAIDASDNFVFGLAACHHWVRPPAIVKIGKRKHPGLIPIEKKESYRWITSALEAKEALSQARMVTIVGDRESDIYDEFCRVPDSRTHLLVRSCHDRAVRVGSEESIKLRAYVDQQPARGSYELKVQGRKFRRTARTAKIDVKFTTVSLKRHVANRNRTLPATVEVSVIEVKEQSETVPQREAPIHWRLLTTHVVDTFEKAIEVVGWYCKRWNIEQLFRTLKTEGLRIESSQAVQAASLFKLTYISLLAAMKIMQLTICRTNEIQRHVAQTFTEEEVQVLAAVEKTLEGKTIAQKNPFPKNTIAWSHWIIGRLGGWKGYKSESPAGPRTLIQGLRRLSDLQIGARLFP